MSTPDRMSLDEREARLRSAGAVDIRSGPRDQARMRPGGDFPEPAGFYCTVDMGDGRRFGGGGQTVDEARHAAFTDSEKELGVE